MVQLTTRKRPMRLAGIGLQLALLAMLSYAPLMSLLATEEHKVTPISLATNAANSNANRRMGESKINKATPLSLSLYSYSSGLTTLDRPNSMQSNLVVKHTYIPSELEKQVMDNAHSYDRVEFPSGCDLWYNRSAPMVRDLHAYKRQLGNYFQRVDRFIKAYTDDDSIVPGTVAVDSNATQPKIADLRHARFANGTTNEAACQALDKSLANRPGGLTGTIAAKFLTWTQAGFVEPLLPPLRHPNFCDDVRNHSAANVRSLRYLVHDFGYMCTQLKPTSRTVMFDVGASLEATFLPKLYAGFGLPFDRVYAYSTSTATTSLVYGRLPEQLRSSYRFVNIGSNASALLDTHSPFKMMLEQYNEADVIAIKIDVDVPDVELALVEELLRNTPRRLLRLVDHLYFEHHVKMAETRAFWKNRTLPKKMSRLHESLDLFAKLRRYGVAAHYWV